MGTVSGYQDAWNTPGWTSQWGYLPNATQQADGLDALRLPTGFVSLPVTCMFRDYWGPVWGSLLFTPSISTAVADGVTLALVPFRVYLRGGTLPPGFALPQPDTTDSTVSPSSWSWQITGRVGASKFNYTINVPTTGTINISGGS